MLINKPPVLACGIHFPSAASTLTKPFAILSLSKTKLILAFYSVNHLFVLPEKAWQSLSELICKVATLPIFRFLMSFYDVMTVTQAESSIKLFTVLLVLPIPSLPFHVAVSLPGL